MSVLFTNTIYYRTPISQNKNDFISPCDGFLSIYKIDKGLVLPVKQSMYSISSLLKNADLADKYKEGICLVIRLSPSNYHRYCYIDNGIMKLNKYIKGFLHTVRPVALETTTVFTENSREITVLATKNFGIVTQVEVGAMLVGKIKNYKKFTYQKGEEKGMFLFGGSTIILLIERDLMKFQDKFWKNTKETLETPIIMGEVLGKKLK